MSATRSISVSERDEDTNHSGHVAVTRLHVGRQHYRHRHRFTVVAKAAFASDDLPEARLEVKFTADSRLTLSAADLPTKTENAPIIGESVVHDLQELRNRREQEVAFQVGGLAKRVDQVGH